MDTGHFVFNRSENGVLGTITQLEPVAEKNILPVVIEDVVPLGYCCRKPSHGCKRNKGKSMINLFPIQLHSFVLTINKNKKSLGSGIAFSLEKTSFVLSDSENSFVLKGKLRNEHFDTISQKKIKSKQRLLFFTGDSTEIRTIAQNNEGCDCCANSTLIDMNFLKQEVTVYSSIVGLPPVYYCDLPDKIIIVSDIYLLQDSLGSSLYFDVDSIRELSCIGYPIGNKTLFQNVKTLPAGHIMHVDKTKQYKLSRHWESTNYREIFSWTDFIELQITAFEKALQRIDLKDSFLSLTAGMDTRAIFAKLTANDHKIPAYTMSGSIMTLDGRTAYKLCEAYDFEHNSIFLGNDFYSQLPFLATEACRLSGGLASLSQAHEVFFYSQIDRSLKARLSGNLGNQVGRGGAENISLRNAGFMNLSSAIKNIDTEQDLTHWYAPYLRSGGCLSYDFLMEQEIPFSSVGNYTIGNYYAVQQSPYADKQLIEISKNRPVALMNEKEISLFEMRMKDLHHRFFGESVKTSFQRELIKRTNGAVAKIPINWGARAKGGASIHGLALGAMALADAFLASKSIDSGPIYNIASCLKIAGVHEYRLPNKWLKGPMKEFARDLFASQVIRESGLFDIPVLENNVQSYFGKNEESYKHMSLTLDLALTAKTFGARVK